VLKKGRCEPRGTLLPLFLPPDPPHFVRGEPGKGVSDEGDNEVGLVQDVAVGDAQHDDAAAAEEGVAQPVLTFSTEMRVAIELDGKARGGAEEVGEVVTDGKLAAEAEAVDLAASEQPPEPLLGDGGMVAMLAGQGNTADKSSFHIGVSTRGTFELRGIDKDQGDLRLRDHERR
jgi:hypothetical protein